MILHYYVDVSGKESTPGERAITAAGYIAHEARWREFEHLWRVTLREAKSDYFHATEFFSCSGPFRWLRDRPDEHRRLATLFALALHTAVPYGFSSSLDLQHFDPLLTRSLRGIKTPHDRIPATMIVVGEVCAQVAQRALPPGGPQAQLILEAGDGVGEILSWLNHLKKIGEPWTGAFVGFTQRPGSECPLQAADYLAHETWREAAQVMRNPGRTWSDTRESYRLLISGSLEAPPDPASVTVDVRYATEAHFAHSAPQLAAFIAAHPEYQKPAWRKQWRRRSRQWLRARWREARAVVRASAKRFWYGRLGRGRKKSRQRRA